MTTTLSRVSSLTVAALAIAAVVAVLACTPTEENTPPQVPDQTRQDPILYAQPTSIPNTLGQPADDSPPPADEKPTADQVDQQFAENQLWCLAWALEDLPPHVYFEFTKLDPANMDDIQRTVWWEQLQRSGTHTRLPTYTKGSSGPPTPLGGEGRAGTCSIYWAEPLSKSNADKRNLQYQTPCLYGLVQAADNRWAQLVEAAVRDDDTDAYDVPNQYVHVLRWMHLTGDELLQMDDPPFELLKRLHDKEFAHDSNIPTNEQVATLKAKYDQDYSVEWTNLVGATLGHNSYRVEECQKYFPQLFYGYWIPFAEPSSKPVLEVTAELADQVREVLDGALHLPKP